MLAPSAAQASEAAVAVADYTAHWLGYSALGLFALAYVLIIMEEVIHLKKSKPVVAAAGLIWMLVAWAYRMDGRSDEAVALLRHNFLEYAELAFFLLSAMVYINTMDERNVFRRLRGFLVSKGLSFRALYWITGIFAFCMSPVADNLTTALVLGAVVMAVGRGNASFVTVSCINIVVAANAGGAFSPFGDITTLMVWQKGMVTFFEFFHLFVPSLVSWLIPAFLMSFAVDNKGGAAAEASGPVVKRGGYVVSALFVLTVALTVILHQALHLPPFFGMMTGLGLLMAYGYFIQRDEAVRWQAPSAPQGFKPAVRPFDVFISVKRVEWDTLIFFYGIILCVGGLAALGYLTELSHYAYGTLGATGANVLVGLLSAVIDNIPVMFAVLTMNPEMSHGQWLLVTLTAGIGGSLLSIGSAAGVALMGQAKGVYTFFSHLKWSWAVALGYAAGVYIHILMNNVQ